MVAFCDMIVFRQRFAGFFALWCLSLPLFAQQNDAWLVLDAAAGKASESPLPGVTVQFGCEDDVSAKRALATDMDGLFPNLLLETPCPESCWASFSFVGYENLELSCKDILANDGVVLLEPRAEALDAVVVTASIAGSTVQEETVPVTVLKPYLSENGNALDLKGLVSKTPGVSIMDDQVSIRGGSGYAYGVGSRVQLLLDDLPLLSGDLGQIWWSYLPMEHIGQVEVVKATASSTYGSGASNGVIHMRTVWPGSKPETMVSLFNGVYSDPDSTNWRWWDHSYSPISNGMNVSHRQAFGKVDVVGGASFFADKTFLSGGHEQRARANLKFRHRHSPTFQYGGSMQAQYQQMGRFILWDDFATSAFLPMEGTSSEDRWVNGHVDGWATYMPLNGGSHQLKTRVYRTSRYGEDTIPTMTSTLSMAQYRYMRPLFEHFTIQVGAFGSIQKSFSSLYPDITLRTFNVASFEQIEWAKNGWKLAGGVRFERNFFPQEVNFASFFPHFPRGVERDEDGNRIWPSNPNAVFDEMSGPIWRFGLNRALTPTTNVRMSYGESLRFASLAERYVEGSLGDAIDIIGNVDLQNESGNNWEIGLVQEVKRDGMSMLFEAAAFLLNYDEMIEYTLAPQVDSLNNLLTTPDGEFMFFFVPLNLGKTRIAGFEVSATGNAKVGGVPIRMVSGYTFNYAGDLVNDPAQDSAGVFLSNFFDSFGEARDSLVAAGSLLKYRNKGALKVDVEWDMGPFTAGIALNHQTFIDAVDWYFEDLIEGLVNYREQFTNGAKRWDARLIYRAPKGQRFSLVVNNLTNGIVSTRPGIMGAPRHVMLRFDTSF